MKLYKPFFPARDVGYSPTYKNKYDSTRIVVGQKFGENLNDFYAQLGMKGHNGIDIPCVKGTPIFASHAGKVIRLSEKPTYGLGVTLQSPDGKFLTIYWHLTEILVKVGDVLRPFDLIGLANSTGYSTGNHLHFGLYPVDEPKTNGYDGAVDPMPYMVEKYHFVLERNLRIGMKGEDVRDLQIFLAYEGFLGQVGFSGFTGYFGTQTFEAARRFQKKYGILATGLVGPLTRAKINQIINT